MRTALGKAVKRLGSAGRANRAEALEWFRAALQAIPGEFGCRVRSRFYGFRCGAGTRVLSGVVIYYPESLLIGRNVGIASGCQFNAGGGIEIGDDVLIGPGTMVWSQNHTFGSSETKIKDQGYERAGVAIEDDVWVGAGSIVLPGVRLANGTVVAAGSVVTKSTRTPIRVVAGTPARPLMRRSPAGQVALVVPQGPRPADPVRVVGGDDCPCQTPTSATGRPPYMKRLRFYSFLRWEISLRWLLCSTGPYAS